MSIDDQRRVTIRARAGLYSLDRTVVLSWLTHDAGKPHEARCTLDCSGDEAAPEDRDADADAAGPNRRSAKASIVERGDMALGVSMLEIVGTDLPVKGPFFLKKRKMALFGRRGRANKQTSFFLEKNLKKWLKIASK